MKAGDLVRWNGKTGWDVGLVVKIGLRASWWRGSFHDGAFIQWAREPKCSGYYPIEHPGLEIVSESR